MNPFERRIRKLEAARAPSKPPLKRVVEVGMFEALDDAVARHVATHGRPTRGHSLLVVPAQPANDAEEAEMRRGFKVQQLELVAFHRNQRLAMEARAEQQRIGHASHPQ